MPIWLAMLSVKGLWNLYRDFHLRFQVLWLNPLF